MDDILGRTNKNPNVTARSGITKNLFFQRRRKYKQIKFGFTRPQIPEGYTLPKRVRALSKFVGRRKAFDIFNIAKKLGEGSFGAVYSDKGLAVKVAAGSIFNKTGYKELEQEKELLKQVESSGVSPRIIASGKGFVAIEKFDGQPLAFYEDRIKKDKVFAEYIFAKIVEAVGAIHRIGIAHKDLHNGNIFITNDYQIRIIDFGLAKKGFGAAYAEAFFGNYDNPGSGITSLIDYIFNHTNSYKVYKKILYEFLSKACEEFDADVDFLFKDYESLTSDEEDPFFDNFNKVRYISSEDSERYIKNLYDKLDSTFRAKSKKITTPRTGILGNFPIKKFAEGGEANKPILSLIGEKKGIIRAKTPLVQQSKKLKLLLKKSRSSTVTADQIGIILDNLNKSDLSSIKHYIKPSGKATAFTLINDNSFYSFLSRFNEFLDNFVRTLNLLMQKIRFGYLFTKREDDRFEKRQEKIRKFVEKVVNKKKEKKKERDKIKADLSRGFDITGALQNIVAGLTAAAGRPEEQPPAPTGPIPEGTNADFWSLAAIASLENGNPQGQADVAQAVYNRLASGVYAGRTIKQLILAPLQFQPVRQSNQTLWAAISDRATAIAAVESHPRGRGRGAQLVDSAARNITNPQYQEVARREIGGRTDFAVPSSARIYPGGIADLTIRGHLFGWYVGPGAVSYGSRRPGPAPVPAFPGITISRASGSILLPELFGPEKINITEESSNLSTYLVNKPTVFKLSPYDEPMIIIPLGRTKGREIMNLIFKERFEQLENKFVSLEKSRNLTDRSTYNINLLSSAEPQTSGISNYSDNLKSSSKKQINTRIDSISNNYKKTSTQSRVVIYTQDIYVT